MDMREAFWLLFGASWEPRTRDVAFSFVKENYDALAARLPEERVAGLMYTGSSYCDPVRRQEVAAFFAERARSAPGGERTLAQVLEGVDLCIALKSAQGASVESFLSTPRQVPSSSGR
jgi:alanyl aminopeptidase